jgi:hypothetical protein
MSGLVGLPGVFQLASEEEEGLLGLSVRSIESHRVACFTFDTAVLILALILALALAQSSPYALVLTHPHLTSTRTFQAANPDEVDPRKTHSDRELRLSRMTCEIGEEELRDREEAFAAKVRRNTTFS